MSTAGLPSARSTGRTSAVTPCMEAPSRRSSQRARKCAARSGSPATKACLAAPLYLSCEAARPTGTSITEPSVRAAVRRPMRVDGALHRAGSYLRSAPGTYVWLAVLFVSTVALHHMSPDFEEDLRVAVHEHPRAVGQPRTRVLITSAMWIDGGLWLPYAVLFTAFHAQAERWLGTLRWLAVAVAAHVLATLISEGALLGAIKRGAAPHSAVDTLDIGVSYALAGVVGVLTVPRRGAVAVPLSGGDPRGLRPAAAHRPHLHRFRAFHIDPDRSLLLSTGQRPRKSMESE